MPQFLNYVIYNGNSGLDFLIATVIFIMSFVALAIFQRILVSRLKKIALKTKTEVDDVLLEILEGLKPPFYFILSIYLSFNYLNFTEGISKFFNIVILSILVYEGIRAAQTIISFVTYKTIKKEDNDAQAKMTVKTFNIFVKIILWSFGVILVLSNAGINVSSLLAGLGIGGIAIALAVQNILKDIFSSFSILVDKPFEIGDFIKVGNDLGVVEKIGIKTSRLRTLDGPVLIISNQELTTARVENFKQIKKRRAVFPLSLEYQNSHDNIAKVPFIIKEIISSQDKADFDRCHFKKIGDSGLDFEVSFYVQTQDYSVFLDVLQEVNLKIFAAFKKEGISFAYPTQTVYKKDI